MISDVQYLPHWRIHHEYALCHLLYDEVIFLPWFYGVAEMERP